MAANEPTHEPRACDGALTKAFGFLGKRWNGILLATLMNGSMGFADLRRAVGGISDSVLSERLGELDRHGFPVPLDRADRDPAAWVRRGAIAAAVSAALLVVGLVAAALLSR